MGHTTVVVSHVGQYHSFTGLKVLLKSKTNIYIHTHRYLYLATQIYVLFLERHSANPLITIFVALLWIFVLKKMQTKATKSIIHGGRLHLHTYS